MSIFGVGVDILKNARMTKIIQGNAKERFLAKVLHLKEIEEFNNKKDIEQMSRYLASRWCFKEAVVKASGRTDLIFPQMYLAKNALGAPFPVFEDTNKTILFTSLGISKAHVSISHDDDYSIAYVILEKL